MHSKTHLHPEVVAVILAGGSGTRLWPLSKKSKPKQFLKLFGTYSLFQLTLFRAKAIPQVRFIVVTHERYHTICKEQIAETHLDDIHMILEPCSRGTAPSIALAAHYARDHFHKKSPLLILPADHLVEDVKSFALAVEGALSEVDPLSFTTFGVEPSSAKTEYGYLCTQKGKDESFFLVSSFIEKPHKELAENLITQQGVYWNSGIFLVQAPVYLSALEKHAPSIFQSTTKAYKVAHSKPLEVDKTHFATSPNKSIDYAVMEKINNTVMVPIETKWSDLGSFRSMLDALTLDQSENSIHGNVTSDKCYRSFFYAEKEFPLTLKGLINHIVISTSEGVFISDRLLSFKVAWKYGAPLPLDRKVKIKAFELKPKESVTLKRSFCSLLLSGKVTHFQESKENFLKKHSLYLLEKETILFNHLEKKAQLLVIEHSFSSLFEVKMV